MAQAVSLMIAQALDAVYGQIIDEYVDRVCQVLSNFEMRREVSELSEPAKTLFEQSRTAKRRDSAAKQLLQPIAIKIRQYGDFEVTIISLIFLINMAVLINTAVP